MSDDFLAAGQCIEKKIRFGVRHLWTDAMVPPHTDCVMMKVTCLLSTSISSSLGWKDLCGKALVPFYPESCDLGGSLLFAAHIQCVPETEF